MTQNQTAQANSSHSHRVTNMVDEVGTTRFAYAPGGLLAGEDQPSRLQRGQERQREALPKISKYLLRAPNPLLLSALRFTGRWADSLMRAEN